MANHIKIVISILGFISLGVGTGSAQDLDKIFIYKDLRKEFVIKPRKKTNLDYLMKRFFLKDSTPENNQCFRSNTDSVIGLDLFGQREVGKKYRSFQGFIIQLNSNPDCVSKAYKKSVRPNSIFMIRETGAKESAMIYDLPDSAIVIILGTTTKYKVSDFCRSFIRHVD